MWRSVLKEPELTSSIALIESVKDNSSSFGSGFLVYADRKATYWLTCAHVIKSKKPSNRIRVDGLPAELIGFNQQELSSLKNRFDLALLKVEGLFKKRPLQLSKPRNRNLRFQTLGHFQDGKTDQLYMKEVFGKLHVDTINLVAHDKHAWVLNLQLDDQFLLEPGYSGSPVFIPNTREVVGVIEKREGKGNTGQAIAIDAATSLFRKVPELRPMLYSQSLGHSSTNQLSKRVMNAIEHPLRWMAGTQVRAILDWFLDQGLTELAVQASEYAKNNSQDLSIELQRYSEERRTQVIADFQWDIEKYLERIYASLLTRNDDLLKINRIRPTLSSTAYEVAFTYINNAIPEHISEKVKSKTETYISVLIDNLAYS